MHMVHIHTCRKNTHKTEIILIFKKIQLQVTGENVVILAVCALVYVSIISILTCSISMKILKLICSISKKININDYIHAKNLFAFFMNCLFSLLTHWPSLTLLNNWGLTPRLSDAVWLHQLDFSFCLMHWLYPSGSTVLFKLEVFPREDRVGSCYSTSLHWWAGFLHFWGFYWERFTNTCNLVMCFSFGCVVCPSLFPLLVDASIKS